MSGQSALLGEPPVTPDDKLVAVAIKALAGSEFFPNKAHPYGQPRPSPDPPNPSDADHIVGLCYFFIFFLFFLVTGRMVIRWKQTKVKFGLDDLFIIPSVATSIVCNALIIYICYSECYGHHIYWCTYENLANMYEALYVNQTIFWVALYSAKISIVFFNRRLTTLAQGWWRIGHWVVLGIVVGCFILALFSTIFECSPVKAHYNLQTLGSTLLKDPKLLHCVDSNKLELANRWLHVITDLMLLSVPLIILYRLQMPTHKKFSIGFLFCFGTVCCVASIVRNYVWTHPTEDFPYDSSALLIWDLVDVNFAPIVACLPVYYPVINWLFRETKSRLPYGRTTGRGTSGHKGSQDTQDMGTKAKGGFLQRVRGHKQADSSLDDIKGPYIRTDDSRLSAIAAGHGSITTTELKHLPREGQEPVPFGRIRRDDEFEMENTRRSDEEQLYKSAPPHF